jgi:hypothetical protein
MAPTTRVRTGASPATFPLVLIVVGQAGVPLVAHAAPLVAGYVHVHGDDVVSDEPSAAVSR